MPGGVGKEKTKLKQFLASVSRRLQNKTSSSSKPAASVSLLDARNPQLIEQLKAQKFVFNKINPQVNRESYSVSSDEDLYSVIKLEGTPDNAFPVINKTAKQTFTSLSTGIVQPKSDLKEFPTSSSDSSNNSSAQIKGNYSYNQIFEQSGENTASENVF